jgi:hypothetical protein
MAEIINEMPDDELDVTIEGEELEVDLEVKEKPGKSTSDVERVVPQKTKQEELFEVEEEDDTPTEDRGKQPLPDDIVKELEEDTFRRLF